MSIPRKGDPIEAAEVLVPKLYAYIETLLKAMEHQGLVIGKYG
jgi:hypothetical protein